MGLIKFIGKKAAAAVTNVASGAASAVMGAVSETAKTATNSVMSIRSEFSNKKNLLVEEKLSHLKKLYDSGLINDTEYQAKKTEIIKSC